MTAHLTKVISEQSNSERFASCCYSAVLITDEKASIPSLLGVSEYSKVGNILSAVKDCITSAPSVTEKFNEFVLLLHDDLKLTDLAVQLVEKLRKM